MAENDRIVTQFEASRGHLLAVAYRMLSSQSEADDAVQEAWLRISRADTSGVENLGGWLTTVVARVCLDMLRARKSRREVPDDAPASEPILHREDGTSPERDVLLSDSVGLALLVVLETLTPGERLAFVLHDMFDLPFEEIASIVGCSSAAARQLASRGRRRVRGASADPEADADLTRQRDVVDAFLAASRSGNLTALLAVLDPEVLLRPDDVAVTASATTQAPGALKLVHGVRGAAAVAATFSGRAKAARPALINGSVGAVWAPGGKTRVAFGFTISDGKIVAIDVVADPEHLRQMDVTIMDGD